MIGTHFTCPCSSLFRQAPPKSSRADETAGDLVDSFVVVDNGQPIESDTQASAIVEPTDGSLDYTAGLTET